MICAWFAATSVLFQIFLFCVIVPVEDPALDVMPSNASGAAASPSVPDFEVSWENFSKVKDFFGLTDQETQQVLLGMIGPNLDELEKGAEKRPSSSTTESAKKKAKVGQAVENPNKAATKAAAKATAAAKPAAKPAAAKPAAAKPAEVEQKPVEFDLDDEADTDVEMSVHSGGDDPESPTPPASVAVHETKEVVCEAPEQPEPVVVPVLKHDDPSAEAARDFDAALEAELSAEIAKVPTPNRAKAWYQ